MDFDSILDRIGQFGLYQKQRSCLLGAFLFWSGIQTMMIVFTQATPKHRCAIPGLENDTYDITTAEQQRLVDLFIPLASNTSSKGPVYSSCHLYSSEVLVGYIRNRSFQGGDVSKLHDLSHLQNRTETTCSRWVFDKSIFSRTIVTQMDFVCDNAILKSHVTMAMMTGKLISCFIVGIIADLFGRRKVLVAGFICFLISTVAITWSVNFIMLAGLYFFAGLCTSGPYAAFFTIVMEMIGQRWRPIVGVGVLFFWSGGLLLLTVVVYFIRDWQVLQLSVSVPNVLLVATSIFIPESVRWLATKERYDEARVIVAQMARTNSVNMPEIVFKKEDDKVESESLLTLRKYPSILLRALIVFFNWFVCSTTYYGLGLNVGQLSGNVILNFFFMALFELAAYVVVIIAFYRVGRKTLYCCTILLGGVACLMSIFPVLYAKDSPWVVVLLSLIGKFGVSGAFSIAWLYTSELFPTFFRVSIMGSSSFFGRVGMMTASYIANLGGEGEGVTLVLPQIMFGVLGVLAGLLALYLPETNRQHLPESMQDAVDMKKNKNALSRKDLELASVTQPLAT